MADGNPDFWVAIAAAAPVAALAHVVTIERAMEPLADAQELAKALRKTQSFGEWLGFAFPAALGIIGVGMPIGALSMALVHLSSKSSGSGAVRVIAIASVLVSFFALLLQTFYLVGYSRARRGPIIGRPPSS
jgi:hypothetical protein